MKVGDLIHAPRYPFWGMGIVVDREEKADGLICVRWFGRDTMDADWRDQRDLEKLS
jgi:hypothetical protein